MRTLAHIRILRPEVALAAFAGVLVLTGGAASAWVLELPAELEVAGPVVTLGDVTGGATMPDEAADLVLVGKGLPGRTYRVTRRGLLRKLSGRRLADDVVLRGAETCVLTVTGTTVNGDVLKGALAAVLQPWLPASDDGSPASAVAVEGELPDVAVGSEWSLELVNPGRLTPGRNLVPVKVASAGHAVRFTATVRCHAYGEVPRLRTALRKGDPLLEEHVVWEWRNLSQVPNGAVVGRDALTGMCAARSLTAGDELREADLKRTPLVRQGDPVELVLGRGGVEVTLRATARQDGAAGQVVSVRNELDGRLVTARVTGPGRVSWRK